MAENEEVPTESESADAPPSGGLKAKLPLVAMVAVGLAIGGGTGAMFVGPMVAKKMGLAPAHADSTATDSTAAEGEHAAEGKEGEGAAADAPAVTLLENLVLNPAGSGGSRFLLLSVAIEAGKASAATEFQARDAELRDIILTALGSKTVDQLTDISTREGIKTELQTAIVGRFGKGTVKRLYFPQFVVQ